VLVAQEDLVLIADVDAGRKLGNVRLAGVVEAKRVVALRAVLLGRLSAFIAVVPRADPFTCTSSSS